MNHIVPDHIERWLLVNGYDNYEVSSIGRVRNNRSGRILKPGVNVHGYLFVVLSKNGKLNNYRVNRLVAEAFCKNPDGKTYVDHIDNNRLNNHYTNLRWTTCSENNRNKQITSNNTSGYIGISWHKARCKWMATYSLDYKTHYIGSFKTKEDAARAYDRAILEVDPEHCTLNFPIPQNQRNVYISYHTLKKHLADIKSVIDNFNKL